MRAICVWLMLSSLALADPRILIPVRVQRVVDGDTLEVDVCYPWGVTLVGQDVRCLGYDAWESSRRRQSVSLVSDEVERGKRATDALCGLLEGARVYLEPGERERDNYGRILARLWIWKEDQLVSVAEWMTAQGHVRSENDIRP